MSHLFQPDRSLLYPQFETYRLHPLDPSDDISSVHLPGAGATQARVGYNTHLLSFKETRARISWNHLTTFGNRGVYIDVDWNVVGFTIDNHFTPHFGIITTLPTPISSAESSQHPEYPSVLALSRTRWVIATGSGTVYILNTSPDDNFTGQFIARYDLVSDTNETLPFILQAAHVEGNVAKILISRSVRNQLGKRKISSSATTFELAEITIDLERENTVDQGPEEVNVNWTLQGGDAPYSCQWGKDGWTVLSSEAFKSEEKEEEETEEDKIKRERQEKIGKLGLGASLSEDSEKETSMQVEEQNQEEEREWPYSWTQTSDSVSISIPLSNSTSRSDISVGLTSTSFSLSINTPVSPILATFVSKPERQFWTAIDPSASTWSFDSTKHQLDLELSKVDLNTRWPSVFSLDEEDEDEEEVPETLSQAILDAVKASFTNIQTRAEGEPAGNRPAIPALLREEMDYDLEDGEDFGENETGVFGEPGGGSKVGREVFIGHIKDGQPTWSKSPVNVVSLPLNGGGGQGGIMVKSAVDGLLFTPSSDPSKEVWNHLSTSPALSFVLSSKRDIRLVRHLPIEPPLQSHDVKKPKVEKATTVLAFDAGGSGMASGNVYIYYPPLSATTAKQGVVRVSGGDRGALLGVGEVTVGGKRVVIALCEKSLVVLHGVLRE